MKRQMYITITMVALMIVVGLSTTKAQTATRLIAHIPFEFSVGNRILPAGEYAVHCTNPASDLKVLQLRSSDGRTNVLLRTSSVIGKMEADAKLVFNRYGDHYFFAQAWLPAETIGMQASKSRSEKRLAREFAGAAKESIAITRQ